MTLDEVMEAVRLEAGCPPDCCSWHRDAWAVLVAEVTRRRAPEQTREGGGEEDDECFCPDPCGGMLYLTASAGSAWLATCGSCGKVWSAQPWALSPTPPAPAETTANPSKEPAP